MIKSDEIRAAKALIKAHNRERKPQRSKPAAPKHKNAPTRVMDKTYLIWIRRLPCVAGLVEGGCHGPMQACHVRMSIPGRPNPGMQRKADDRITWPGCAHHHLHDQHAGSERAFWARLRIDPFDLCATLSATFDADADGHAALLDFVRRT